MLGQKNILYILLKAHELQLLFHSGAAPITLPIPPNIISNLEIIDRDGLNNLVATWAKTITYQATEIIWLLSPALVFETVIPDSEKQLWDTKTVQFLDSVPFEEVMSLVTSSVGGRRIVATSQDLITAFIEAFSQVGYSSKAILPAKLFAIDTTLKSDSAKTISSQLSGFMAQNLLNHEEQLSSQKVHLKETTSATQKPKSSLPLLLSVFGVLLAILAVVIYLNQ